MPLQFWASPLVPSRMSKASGQVFLLEMSLSLVLPASSSPSTVISSLKAFVYSTRQERGFFCAGVKWGSACSIPWDVPSLLPGCGGWEPWGDGGGDPPEEAQEEETSGQRLHQPCWRRRRRRRILQGKEETRTPACGEAVPESPQTHQADERRGRHRHQLPRRVRKGFCVFIHLSIVFSFPDRGKAVIDELRIYHFAEACYWCFYLFLWIISPWINVFLETDFD